MPLGINGTKLTRARYTACNNPKNYKSFKNNKKQQQQYYYNY